MRSLQKEIEIVTTLASVARKNYEVAVAEGEEVSVADINAVLDSILERLKIIADLAAEK